MAGDILDYIKKSAEVVDAKIKEYIKLVDVDANQLFEAMNYSLFAGGKRIRPVLTMAVAKILGKDFQKVMPIACAIEMIHTYSLIHDDLPAMDNDDLRRGKPTCHVRYGEDVAILAGDTLQCYAIEMLVVESQKLNIANEIIVELVKRLVQACGLHGMAGGQMMDIAAEKQSIDLDHLQKIHKLKTGALLNLAITAPAEIFGVSQEQRQVLSQYAESIGLSFQIKDDILDVEGSAEELGKTPGKDAKMEKSTYVSLLGIDQAKAFMLKETQKAYNAAKFFGEDNVLLGIAQYLLERTS